MHHNEKEKGWVHFFLLFGCGRQDKEVNGDVDESPISFLQGKEDHFSEWFSEKIHRSL